MSRLRLLKLLYIADRECLSETLRSITADSVVAMDNGPVLSRTYDLIKGNTLSGGTWANHIRSEGAQDVVVFLDPGVSKLSGFEMKKLNNVLERFAENDDYAVADHTHDFSEWQKNRPDRGGCNAISFDDRLEALGLGADERAKIVASYGEDAEFARILGGIGG